MKLDLQSSLACRQENHPASRAVQSLAASDRLLSATHAMQLLSASSAKKVEQPSGTPIVSTMSKLLLVVEVACQSLT